jgi:hypothetical protein
MARSPAGQQLDLINIMAYDAGNVASTGAQRVHRLQPGVHAQAGRTPVPGAHGSLSHCTKPVCVCVCVS